MIYLFLIILAFTLLWFITKCSVLYIVAKSFSHKRNNVLNTIISYFKAKSDVKIFLAYLSSMVSIAGYGPDLLSVTLDFLFKDKYIHLIAKIQNNSGWESICIAILITISFSIFLFYRYKNQEHQFSSEIISKTNEILEGQSAMESRLSSELSEIRKIITDSTTSEALTTIAEELGGCIQSLRVKTALTLLNKLENSVSSNQNKKLSSLIHYEKALCQRHINGEDCKKSFHEAYSLMKESNEYNVEIVGGEILSLLMEKQIDRAKSLSSELRLHSNNSVWAWIPELLSSSCPQFTLNQIPEELKNEFLFGELLRLNSDIPFTCGLVSDNYIFAPLNEITVDNLSVWVLHLSLSLNKLFHNWSFDSALIVTSPLQDQCLKHFYEISAKYIALLEKTEADNLLPDVLFVHDFCAFTQDHQQVHLEQINKNLPSENFKEIYSLMKINMMSVLKQHKEALGYIDSICHLTCDILNIRLRLSMELLDIQNIKKSYQLAIDRSIVFPKHRFGYFISALKLYSKDIAALALAIQFEDSHDEIVYHTIANHYIGTPIDISILKNNENSVSPLLKILIADVYKEVGNIQDAVVLAKDSLEGPICDFRSYIYIDILKASERSGVELYHYLRSLRENGFAGNDSWLADEVNLAVGMSDYENALNPIQILYRKHPNNYSIFEKYLIVLDKIGDEQKIREITEGVEGLNIDPEYCHNIFNVLIKNKLTDRAVSFLFHSIMESNDQGLRALYYQAALNNNIGKFIMQQPEVISSGDYVLLDKDNKEMYETIYSNSRLESLIGCSVGDETEVVLYNGVEHYRVKAIYTKYFRLLRDVSNDAQNNRFKEFTCFTLDDLKGNDGDILSNLEKITSSISGYSHQDRDNNLSDYKNGKLPLGMLVNRSELVGGMYEKLFGQFHIYVPLSTLIIKNIEESNYNLKDVNYILDLSSLLMIEELDNQFHLEFNKKFIIPRGLYQLLKDTVRREQIGVFSFVSQSVFNQLYIPNPEEGETPLLGKIKQLLVWIESKCQIKTAESKVDLIRHSKHMDMDYMDIESESMLLALQPKCVLISEDLGMIASLSQSTPMMNIETWARILFPSVAKSITSYLAKHYYIGLQLASNDIVDIYLSSDSEIRNILDLSLSINPFIWQSAMEAASNIALNAKNQDNETKSIILFESIFKHFDPKTCVSMSAATILKYNNQYVQFCIIKALNNVHPGIIHKKEQ